MKFKTFFILALMLCVFSSCCGQANGSDYIDSNITSVHTKDKDTVYFPDNDMGKLLKKAWDLEEERIADVRNKPEIILVPYFELKKIVTRRNNIVIHYETGTKNGVK